MPVTTATQIAGTYGPARGSAGGFRSDLKSHALPVRSLAFSKDGSTLADASDDGDTNRWDVRTGKRIGGRLQIRSEVARPAGALAGVLQGRQHPCGCQ